MPALALTDHGNLFGAIEFYDKARKAGIKPIIGIEAYVAQGSHTDRDPAARQQQPPGPAGAQPGRLPEPDQAHLALLPRGLLLQAAHRPRAAARAQRRPDRALGLPQGRDQRAHPRPARSGGRGDGARCTGRSSARATSSSSCRTTASRSSAAANEVLRRLSKKLGLPLVATNDCHYLRKGDAVAHDVLLCIGTQRTCSTIRTACKYASRGVLPQERATRCAALFPDDRGAIEQHAARSPSAATSRSGEGSSTCRSSRCPPGETRRRLLRAPARRRPRGALRRRCAAAATTGSRGTRWSSTASASSYEIGVIQRMGFAGYFLIVWDFIRYAREQRHPGRARPRLGRRLAGLLRAAHHRHRSAAVRPAVRALPEPRARHRCPTSTSTSAMRRRGEVHPVRQREVRPRPGGADHHLRHPGREGRAARRRPRAGLPFAKVDRIAKLLPDMDEVAGARRRGRSTALSAEVGARTRRSRQSSRSAAASRG